MISRNKNLGILMLFGIFLCSCSPLKVTDAYFNKVIPGHRGSDTKTEFIVLFKKSPKSDISVKSVTIYGYEEKDYHFSSLVLNDISMSKTLTTTDKLPSFALYLSTAKAKDITPSSSTSLYAKVTYSDGRKEKILNVKFEDKGTRRLRN